MFLVIIHCFPIQVLLPQSVLSNPLGVKLVPHSGVVGPRKLGDPSEETQVITFWNPWWPGAGSSDAASEPLGARHTQPPTHPSCDRLPSTDQAQVMRQHVLLTLTISSSLPAFNSTKKRKRKKAVAGLPVVEVMIEINLDQNVVSGPDHHEGRVLQQHLISSFSSSHSLAWMSVTVIWQNKCKKQSKRSWPPWPPLTLHHVLLAYSMAAPSEVPSNSHYGLYGPLVFILSSLPPLKKCMTEHVIRS